MTPGTYHVTFRAFQISVQEIGEFVEKRATPQCSYGALEFLENEP
jgi:hypothetical protein